MVGKRVCANVPGLGEAMFVPRCGLSARAGGVSIPLDVARARSRASGSELGPVPWPPADLPRCEGPRSFAVHSSAATQRSTQNWHGHGESDCLIKTKHCEGPKGC